MNINKIKSEFPIFSKKVHNNDLVYLDSANSSQKPLVVVDRIYDFYTKEFSNIGRSRISARSIAQKQIFRIYM